MIKEYRVVIVHSLTQEEEEGVMTFDLLDLKAVRPFIDSSGEEVADKSIIYFSYDHFVSFESYEDVLKDWMHARGTDIIRLVQI